MICRRKYGRIHYHLRTKYGKANKCESDTCKGVSTKYEWALKKGREYTTNPNDYLHLCKSCHTLYDGHNLSEEGRLKLKDLAKDRFTGVEPPNKGKCNKVIKVCLNCSIEYRARLSKNKKYCSMKCRDKHSKGGHGARSTKVMLDNKYLFDSILIAAEKTGVSNTSISNNLNGRSKKTKVGVWTYVKNK